MIVTVICDRCESAAATRIVFETKWSQEALCDVCHEDVDHDVIHDCKILATDLRSALRPLVAANPDAVTKDYVETITRRYVVPVFLPPYDSAVKAALRDKTCFVSRRVEGGKALCYEVVE